MLRYVAFLIVIALLTLLLLRRFARRNAPERMGPPPPTWPWLLVPLAIALVVAFGFGLREWALGD